MHPTLISPKDSITKGKSSRETYYFDILKSGCLMAFAKVYAHYYKRVYFRGRKFMKDEFVLENLVQDTFLILWNKRDNIESPDHLVGFLFKVISTECRWYYSRTKHRFDRDFYSLDNFPDYQDYMLGHDPADLDEHFKDQQNRQKDYEQVVNILPLLGSQRKHLIELCLQHGFKYKIISEQLGVSINEASSTMKKTIEEIKTILNQGYIFKTENMDNEHSKYPLEMTEQEARVLELRCKKQYSFAAIALELKLSQKEVQRAFSAAYKFLKENQLQSA